MDGSLAATYTLIYTFLTKQSHTKAAEAVKKAARDVVVLKDDLIQDGPTLDEIIREWKGRKPTQPTEDKDSTSSSSESESESETPKASASSGSSDSSSESEPGNIKKMNKANTSAPEIKALVPPLDSSSESDTTLPVWKSKKVKSSSSSCSHSSAESSTTTPMLKLAPKKSPNARTAVKLSVSASSSSSESDSDSATENEKQIPTSASNSKLPSTDPESSDLESNSESSSSADSPNSPESDSDEPSDPESDSEEENDNDAADTKPRKPLEHESSRTLTSGGDSSPDEDEDGDVSMSDVATRENTTKNGHVVNVKGDESSDDTSESDSGSSSSSEEEDGEEDDVKEPPKRADKFTKEKPKACESSSSDSDGQPPAAKKRKASEDRGMVDASTSKSTSRSTSVFSSAKATPDGSMQTNGNGNGTRGPRKSNTPFKRVDPSKVSLDVVMDNRYEAKAGSTNDYGQRAHRDLIVTRGSGFRKEKNKKKRGSYKGGEITMESHSFKFTD